jgi:uncharacterized ion transporter superfamily protein YfcC
VEKQAVEKKKLNVPDTFVIIFFLMVVLTLLTYIIPAGQYDTIVDTATGRSVVDPESFHFIERTPVSLIGFLEAIYKGCQNSAGIIFMIFLLAAYSNIINDTGAISRGISLIAKKYDRKALYAIPVIMVALSLLGASAVIVDACIAFIPVGMIIAKKLNLDPVAGAAVIYLGCYAGWNSSFMAATSVQTAQAIAGLPLLSGTGFRFVVYMIFTAITILYVMRYCIKVNRNRSNSVLDPDMLEQFDAEVVTIDEGKFGGKDILIILIFFGGIVFYIIGSMLWSWGLDKMVAVIMAIGIISGLLGGMSANEMARSFTAGIKDVSFGAILVGVASSLAVIMNSGNIIHTIIYGASKIMTLFPGAIAGVIMFFINLGFNFFVPSGPAQAAIVMPIMAPMADVIGITRQVAVLCFQYGDGLSNSIIPTSGVLMGVLGMAKIPYPKWMKFMLKLFAIWVAYISVVIVIAVLSGYR